MTRASMKIAGVLAAAMAIGAPALAQGPGQGQGRGPGQGPANVIENCAAEIEQHCAEVEHGQGAVPACLEKHLDTLSDTCKTALQSRGPHGRRRMQQGG